MPWHTYLSSNMVCVERLTTTYQIGEWQLVARHWTQEWQGRCLWRERGVKILHEISMVKNSCNDRLSLIEKEKSSGSFSLREPNPQLSFQKEIVVPCHGIPLVTYVYRESSLRIVFHQREPTGLWMITQWESYYYLGSRNQWSGTMESVKNELHQFLFWFYEYEKLIV